MKKLILSVVLGLMVTFSVGSAVSAGTKITESKDIKIVIGSEHKDVSNVPILVNGRTMLPLREIAAQIGVTDDDEHIKWDSVQKSVYLAKDNTVINLEIDNKTALVNSQSVELDVAPIIYSNRTYIPVRFVSQSLGKKVVWDDSTKSVLICEEDNYNKIKEILDKSKSAMDSLKKYKFNMNMEMSAKGEDGENVSLMKYIMSSELDNENKKAVINLDMNMLVFMNIKTQSYMENNTVYTNSSFTNKWEKETKSEVEYYKEFQNSKDINVFVNNDITSAGLKIAESKNPDELVLEGDVIIKDIASSAASEAGSEGSSPSPSPSDNFTLSIIIDKNTYFIKEVTMKFSGKFSDEDSTESISLFNANSFDANINCTFSDVNGDFEVVPPEDLDMSKVKEKTSDGSLEGLMKV